MLKGGWMSELDRIGKLIKQSNKSTETKMRLLNDRIDGAYNCINYNYRIQNDKNDKYDEYEKKIRGINNCNLGLLVWNIITIIFIWLHIFN